MFWNKKTRVIFICLANICRSPMAEAVFRDAVKKAKLDRKFEIDSASIIGWYTGKNAHSGTLRILEEHNIDNRNLKSRLLTEADGDKADYLICMDQQVYEDTIMRVGSANADKVYLFNSFLGREDGVADPMKTKDFETCFINIDEGVEAILTHIRKEKGF